MKRRHKIISLFLLLSAIMPKGRAQPSFDSILEVTRAEYGFPALSAIIVLNNGNIYNGLSGVRKYGDETPVTANDCWHLGSNCKSFTATIVGRLVEQGLARWDMTIGEVLGSSIQISEGYKSVTFYQLFSHCGGLPHDFKYNTAWKNAVKRKGNIHKQRLDLLSPILSEPPEYKPGSEHHYSNSGIVLAGLMAEQITGLTWEDLVFKEVIEPLGITSAGFGAPGTQNTIFQPWGHQVDKNKIIPVNPGPKADNPPAMGPSGTLYMSLPDYALFLMEQIQGEKGNGKLLTADTYKIMHSDPDGKGCGLGWGVDNEPVFGRVLNHTGSNGYWFHRVWIAPETGIGIAIASNIAISESQKAFEELLAQLKQIALKMNSQNRY